MKDNIADIYPLTPIQAGILFHCLHDGRRALYCGQVVLAVEGELDLAAYRKAWERTIDRHPVLRTLILSDLPDKPLQVVLESVELPFESHDWRNIAADCQTERIRDFLVQDQERGFNLAQAPLTRITVIQVAERAHRIVWTQHHIVLDGWSIPILLREVEAQYHSLVSGGSLHLSQPRPFRDFVEYVAGQDQHAAEKFWRDHLQGFDGPSSLGELASTRHEVPARSSTFGEVELCLPLELTSALIQRARWSKVTLSTLIQAAWALLLARCGGKDHVIFGVNFAGRPPEFDGVESAVGIFINTLPLQVHIREEASIEQFLRNIHAAHFSMTEYQNSSLTDIQSWIGNSHQEGLFETIVVFQKHPAVASEKKASLKHQMVSGHDTTNYPLALLVSHHKLINLRCIFDVQGFEPSTVERILGYMGTLLEQLTDDTDRQVRNLHLLGKAERQQLLEEWNQTGREYAGSTTVHEFFERQAEKTPAAVAVGYEKEQVSYEELNRKANQIAHYLRRHEVGPEVRVGICLERGIDLIQVLLGILKAGGAYVPLDPKYPQQRLTYMVKNSGARLVITQESIKKQGKLDEFDSTTVVTLEDLKPVAHQESEQNPSSHATAQNLSYVIYTSGSTGQPKGVAIQHGSAATLLQWAREIFTAEELGGVLAATSVCFDLSVFEMFVPLAWGGKVVMTRNALELKEVAKNQEVTLVNTVPSVISALLSTGGLPISVQTVNLAGEPLPEKLVEQVYQQKQVKRVWDLYGPSEDTTYSTYGMRCVGESANIGKPIANTQVYVLDHRMEPTPAGVRGELYIGGAGLARGYFKQPALTAEKFLPHPFSDRGERLYRTGDIVRWRMDGKLEFLGRADHQVKIRGFRIECGEIETVLNGQNAIQSSVVVVREDVPGDKQLVAYLVQKPGVDLDIRELRASMQQRVPAYMVPAHMMLLPKLPLTSNGKIDRTKLPAIEASGDQSTAATPTVVRELIANIWTELLGRTQIADHENFFDLGGHSIMAMQVISRVREAFAIDLPIKSLFTAPALGEFSQCVESAMRLRDGQKMPALTKAQMNGSQPLSFAQRRLWFLQQVEVENSMYNLAVVLRLQGELDETALKRSLAEVQRRHQVLRTVFPMGKEGPVQHVLEQECPIELLDFRAQPSETGKAEADAAVQETIKRSFALQTQPGIRILLVRLWQNEYKLAIALHHIVCDGWSIQIFLRELQLLYNAFVEGKESSLPDLQIQYGDYAQWQDEWLQGEELAQQLRYWKEQLEGVPTVLELPGSQPRPAMQSYKGHMITATLPDSLRNACYELSRRESSTLFMTLLAAFVASLHEWARRDEFLVGIDIANRHFPQTEQLIGLFINQIVLRANLKGDPSFIELLSRIRQACLGAYAHQDVPFDKLVGSLADTRTLRYNPLFQVMFGLQKHAENSCKLKGLIIEPELPEVNTSVFDLSFYMVETKAGFNINVRYNTDLLSQQAIRKFIQNFEIFLEKAIERPEEHLSELMYKAGQFVLKHKNAEKNLLHEQMLNRLATAAPHRVRIQ
ncbi:MAG TPA: amino acid adenylation domain-containing protein [Candidatus Angelobacter sp.]|nr:amino acid adenylation domain-containing protein [Candidatus Angelobacter sp.]